VLCSIRERLRGVKKQQNTVEERMKEIRLENRAKLLLMQCMNMTEAQAHRYMQQQAMDRHLSKHEVAENIIQTYHPDT
jgi:response regulator NasT